MRSGTYVENRQPIPKVIHYIWVGGPIKPKYLQAIRGLTKAAARQGYEVHLWLDDERNYFHTAEKHNLHVSQLKLRNIKNELFNAMASDPFYLGDDPNFPLQAGEEKTDRARLMRQYILREMVGFNNFAAASDLIRYEVLRKEGGWYCDTDTYFYEINSPFYPDFPNVDVSKDLAMHIENYFYQYRDYLTHLKKYNTIRDPIPPFMPDERLKDYVAADRYQQIISEFESAKLYCMQQLKNKTKTNASPQGVNKDKEVKEYIPKLGLMADVSRRKRGNQEFIVSSNNDLLAAVKNNAIIKKVILRCLDKYKAADTAAHEMDNKRSVLNYESRKNLTVEISGPDMLMEVIKEEWEGVKRYLAEKNISPDEYFASLQLRDFAGFNARGIRENTWLSATKTGSFDTFSIPHTMLFLSQDEKAATDDALEGKSKVKKRMSGQK